MSGGAGNDVVILSSKASTSPITADVLAGANNDVTLDTGNDIAYVLTSNNTISGGMGSDTIIVAGGHDDVIYGDSGNDTFFFASVDNVTVTGGVGADRYVFGSYTPIALPGTVVPQVVREDLSLMDNIHITDFAKGKDKIDLSAYGVHFKDISVDSNQFLVSNGSQGVILDVTLDGYTHAITASDFIGLIA